jgi:FAD/FMN-containing dehydrogenase
MGELTRRAILLAGGSIVGGIAGAKLTSKRPPLAGTTSLQPVGADGTMNDASLLSETRIFRHTVAVENPTEILADKIRAEIAAARDEGRPFNVGAARHSMGGHAIPTNGHAMTFDNGFTQINRGGTTYRAHAGARWSDVIRALDPLGFGPKVMQSNNDFGVAATFCVNAHGWPAPHGPMGSTVRSMFIVRPDGELVRCSRTENAPLFFASMGGYGLTGAVIELEVEAEPNLNLEPTFRKVPSRDFAPFFVGAIDSGDVNMAYGRLNVDRDTFFEDAMVITYRAAADQNIVPPASSSGTLSQLSRHVFRAQVANERAKDLRWWFETGLGTMIASGPVSRNSLINEPVVTLEDKDPTRTDILHEYFVPPGRFADFVTACQEVIPSSYQELLNITLRYVAGDEESVLAYAPAPRIACVMLFSQEMTQRAETDHARMTQDLIDRVLDLGGTYYLPYRPHATNQQFRRGYPNAEKFVAEKRVYDPDLVFRNGFWDRYLADMA